MGASILFFSISLSCKDNDDDLGLVWLERLIIAVVHNFISHHELIWIVPVVNHSQIDTVYVLLTAVDCIYMQAAPDYLYSRVKLMES